MEGHPLRFLTLVRHLARTEQPFVCFSVSLSMEDFSLVVSTEEKEFQPLGKAWGSKACVGHSWGKDAEPDVLDMDVPGKPGDLLRVHLLKLLPWLPCLVTGLRHICSVPLWSGPHVALQLTLISF